MNFLKKKFLDLWDDFCLMLIENEIEVLKKKAETGDWSYYDKNRTFSLLEMYENSRNRVMKRIGDRSASAGKAKAAAA